MSGFQLSFSSTHIHTPGDEPDVLVAMNPAALKANLGDLPVGGALVVNEDAFTAGNLGKVGYAANPLSDGSLSAYNVFSIPISTLNARALEGLELTNKQVDLTKNFFALGLMFWLYERSMEPTIRWIDEKFSKRPVIAEGNKRALKAGYAFGETTEIFHERYIVPPARLRPGRYRNITGNEATALGLRRGLAARRPAALLRLVPDHPGLGHPPPARRLQELRGQDVPGGGRDRGDRRGDRGVATAARSGSPARPAPASRSRARPWGSRSWSSCRSSSSTSSAAARPPACPRRPSRATSSRSCSGGTRTRRSRSSPRRRRPSASSSRSRPGGSR